MNLREISIFKDLSDEDLKKNNSENKIWRKNISKGFTNIYRRRSNRSNVLPPRR